MPTLAELRAAYNKRLQDQAEALKDHLEEIAESRAFEEKEEAALEKAKRNPSLRSSKRYLEEEKAREVLRAKQKAILEKIEADREAGIQYTPSPSAIAYRLKQEAARKERIAAGDWRVILGKR